MNTTQDPVTPDLQAELDAARARIAELEAALKPFAAIGKHWLTEVEPKYHHSEVGYEETDSEFYTLYLPDSKRPLTIQHMIDAYIATRTEPQS
jgi:hypothetical protein